MIPDFTRAVIRGSSKVETASNWPDVFMSSGRKEKENNITVWCGVTRWGERGYNWQDVFLIALSAITISVEATIDCNYNFEEIAY